LQRQVDYLRSHPEVGLVHTDFDDLVRSGGQWRRFPSHQKRVRGDVPQGRVFERLLHGNFIQTCTVCLRTDIAREYFASGLPIASYPVGDWPLFLHVAARHEIEFLKESMAAYRRTPGSMMNSGTIFRLRTLAAYVPMIEEFAHRGNVSASIRTNALAPVYRSIYSLSLLANDREAMGSARDWLLANNPLYLKPLRRRLIPWLFQIPFVGGFLGLAQRMRCWVEDPRANR
jgi:hypothetical protein